MKSAITFACAVAATSATQALGRRLASNHYNHYNDFEVVEKAFLADTGKAPVKLPLFETVYSTEDENKFTKIMRKSVDAFIPYIKDFTYDVEKHFEVPFYTAGRSNTTVTLHKYGDAEAKTVTMGYNFEDNTETVMDEKKGNIGVEAQLDSNSVFTSFCYPPEIAFTNLTITDYVKGVYFTSQPSSPCKQYNQWDNVHSAVQSIDKYTDCQYVVTTKIKSTDVYVTLKAKLSGLTTGTVKLETVIKNQIPSKLRMSVNKKCTHTHNKSGLLHFTKTSNNEDEKETYICLENAYWQETKFFIKDCSVYDSNASKWQISQICDAFKKVFSTVNVKSLQSLFNYEFPQKLPKCYSSSKLRKMSKQNK